MADSYDVTENLPGYLNLADVSVSKGKRKPCAYKVKKNVLGRPIATEKHRECDASGCRTYKSVDRRVKGALVQAYDCRQKKIRVRNGYQVQDVPYVGPYGTGLTQRIVPNIAEQTLVGNPKKHGKAFYVRNQQELNQRMLRDMYGTESSESETDSESSEPPVRVKSKSKSKRNSKRNSKSKSKPKAAGGVDSGNAVKTTAGGGETATATATATKQTEPITGGDSKSHHKTHDERYRNIQEHARSKGYIPVSTERMIDEFGREIVRHRYIKYSGSDRHSKPEFIATVDGANWTSLGDASMYFSNGVFQPTIYYSSISPSERIYVTPTYEGDGYGMAKPSFYERAWSNNNYVDYNYGNYRNNELFVTRTSRPGSFLYRDNIAAIPSFPAYGGIPMRPVGSLPNVIAPFRFDERDMDLNGLLTIRAAPYAEYWSQLAKSLGDSSNDTPKSIRMMEAELWDLNNKDEARKQFGFGSGNGYGGRGLAMMPPALRQRIFPGVVYGAPSGFLGSIGPVATIPAYEDPNYKMYGDANDIPGDLRTLKGIYQAFAELSREDGNPAPADLPDRISFRLVEAYMLYALYKLQRDQKKQYLAGNLRDYEKALLSRPLFGFGAGLQAYFLTQPPYSDKKGFVTVDTTPLSSYSRGPYGSYVSSYGPSSRYYPAGPVSSQFLYYPPSYSNVRFGGDRAQAQPQPQPPNAGGALIQQQQPQLRRIEIVSAQPIAKHR